MTRESGLDYFHARYYNPRLGRFMSPDPANIGAVADNPQSWNAYSYVLNNPESLTDPSGMDPCSDGDWSACASEQVASFGQVTISCSVDMIDAPCSEVSSFLSSGQVVRCPNNMCSFTRTGPNGVSYQVVATQDGLAYKNLANGETFTNGSEFGWPDLSDAAASPWPVPLPQTPRIGPYKPPAPPQPQKVTGACMAGALIQNFLGSEGQAGLSTAVNVAAAVALHGAEDTAAALLPGPGWLYLGVAATYDAAMVAKSYTDCKYGSGPGLP